MARQPSRFIIRTPWCVAVSVASHTHIYIICTIDIAPVEKLKFKVLRTCMYIPNCDVWV